MVRLNFFCLLVLLSGCAAERVHMVRPAGSNAAPHQAVPAPGLNLVAPAGAMSPRALPADTPGLAERLASRVREVVQPARPVIRSLPPRALPLVVDDSPPVASGNLDLRLPSDSRHPGEVLEPLAEQPGAPLLPSMFINKEPESPGDFELGGRLLTNPDSNEQIEGAELQFRFLH